MTIFKGTPNFVSAEMLVLMREPKGLIDLYYNDAFGLKFIVNSIKKVNSAE